tara:strand:- start:204 stop:356 length:153 start_codon:yes stop_codon:yes gene_type:complete
MNDEERVFTQQIIAESAIDSQNIKIATLIQEKKILESKIKELLEKLEGAK